MTNYFNEKSKVCFYDRVTRVDKKSTLFGIIDQLQHLAQNTLFIGSWLVTIHIIGKISSKIIPFTS